MVGVHNWARERNLPRFSINHHEVDFLKNQPLGFKKPSLVYQLGV